MALLELFKRQVTDEAAFYLNNQSLDQSTGTSSARCTICNRDPAKIYFGAIACNPCRAFFRRTIRLKLKPECKCSGRCKLDDASDIMSCMKCRLEKCLVVGMKPEAVQPARDFISRKGASTTSNAKESCVGNRMSSARTESFGVFVVNPSPKQMLHFAEKTWAESVHYALVFDRDQRQKVRASMRNALALMDTNGRCSTDSTSILTSPLFNKSLFRLLLSTQASTIVEVAKNIDLFSSCSVQTQVALLKSYSPAQIVLEVINNATTLNNNNNWLMISQRRDVPFFAMLTDELVPQFSSLQLDEVETASLGRIVFWNSDDLEVDDHKAVRDRQLQWVYGLEGYVLNKPNAGYGRFATLIELAGKLQRISAHFRPYVGTFIRGEDSLIHDLFLQP